MTGKILTQVAPWVFLGAGLLALLLVVQHNVQKRQALAAAEQAALEAPQKAAQVGVVPANFPYTQQMADYCYQAALAGWTPDGCDQLYEYAQLYYPQFYTQLISYWPWYYDNYFWPYYGGGGSWGGWGGWWPGRGCRGGHCGGWGGHGRGWGGHGRGWGGWGRGRGGWGGHGGGRGWGGGGRGGWGGGRGGGGGGRGGGGGGRGGGRR